MTKTLDRRGSQAASETLMSDRFYRTKPTPASGWATLETTAFETPSFFQREFGDQGEFVFEAQLVEWQQSLIDRMCELGELPNNWNSYRAERINIETAGFALSTLLNLLKSDDPMPSIVPTSRGGVLVEWHVAGVDLELDFRSPTWLHMSFEKGGRESEIDDANFDQVRQFFSQLRQSR